MSDKKLVTIVASPGSGNMVTEATQFNEKLDPGSRAPTGEVVATGKYSGERFPRSHQIVRPVWSLARNRWLIGDEISQDKLNEIVQSFNFTYETGSRQGELIESANPRVFGDAFFNHRLLKMKFKEGELILDPSNPQDYFFLECMKASVEFKSEDEKDGIKLAKGRYTIIDEEIKKEKDHKKVSSEVEAISLFANMNFTKKRQIAYAMGLLVTETMDAQDLDRLMYAEITSVTSNVDGKSGAELFVEMAKLAPEELNLKYLVNRALKKAILRRDGQNLVLFGQKVGRSLKDVTIYLNDPENELQLDMLRKELGE